MAKIKRELLLKELNSVVPIKFHAIIYYNCTRV